MTTAVATTQDFQERLFQKIRADIGTLMTDEELKSLVAKTMERVFFTPEIEKDNWGHERSKKPPKIEQLIQEIMQPSLTAAMRTWLDEHPDVVKKALDDALAGGLASSVLRAFDLILSAQFANMQVNLNQALQNALHR